ncbi:MAG: DMT family transporter [Candidatus Helarchaeota archaeon]
MELREKQKGYLLCLSGVVTWSFAEIIVKLLQGTVGPVSLSFLRFFLAGVFLFLILGIQKETKDLWKIFKKNKWTFIIAGILGLSLSNVLLFTGIQLSQANIAAGLYVSYTLFTSIYSIFIVRERSNISLKVLGYVVGFLGTLMLVSNFQLGLFIAPQFLLGNILIVVAASFYGTHVVAGKRILLLNEGVSNVEIKFNLLTFLIASIPCFIFVAFTPELPVLFLHGPIEWMLILFLSVGTTAVGYYLFFKGVQKIDVSHGISLALLKPILVTFLAFFILGELPTMALFIALPLISIAILLINKQDKVASRRNHGKIS